MLRSHQGYRWYSGSHPPPHPAPVMTLFGASGGRRGWRARCSGVACRTRCHSECFPPLSLSASTLSVSSGSSLGSLASSRGSLNTSSRGSLSSLSSGELYYTGQSDQVDADYQCKLDLLLQEKGGYIPSGPITTIHENEVVKSPSQPGQSGPCGAAATATGHTPPRTEAPKSVTSLSSRSSLSSLSPPGSPLVLEGTFPMSSHDVPLHRFTADFEDCELSSRFADIGLGDNQILLDSNSGGASQSLAEDKDLSECAREPLYEGTAGEPRPLLPRFPS